MDFIQNAFAVGRQVLILFIMMGAGFLSRRAKFLNNDGNSQITKILLYVVTPCIIIHSFTRLERSADAALDILTAFGFAFAVHALGIVLSLLFFQRGESGQRSILRLAVPFSNCGFIGIPVAAAVLGEDSVVWVSIYIAVFNLLVWTVGLAFFPARRQSLTKLLLNPGLIGVVIGIAVYASGLTLPVLAAEPLKSLASLNTPLAMLVTGSFLAEANFKPRKGDGQMWLSIVMRLVAVPGLALAPAWALGLRGAVVLACMVPAAAPVSTNAILFPALFGGDTELGTRIVPLSNIAGLLTMPLVLALSQVLLV